MAIVLSFFLPFSTLLASIPTPVMGGVCIALYGFIAVSGLKMIQNVDLGDNRNLFVVSVILIAGVGGFAMKFVFPNASYIQLTEVACALILGIIVNVMVGFARKDKEQPNEEK
jgi:uracil permease